MWPCNWHSLGGCQKYSFKMFHLSHHQPMDDGLRDNSTMFFFALGFRKQIVKQLDFTKIQNEKHTSRHKRNCYFFSVKIPFFFGYFFLYILECMSSKRAKSISLLLPANTDFNWMENLCACDCTVCTFSIVVYRKNVERNTHQLNAENTRQNIWKKQARERQKNKRRHNTHRLQQ